MTDRYLSRRDLLKTSAALGLGLAAAPYLHLDGFNGLDGIAAAALNGKEKPPLRNPGSRPDPKRREGTDLLPKIDHIVVVMMENHSFDNYFGMLRRGDGLSLDKHGKPKNTNPDGKGNLIRSFHMPSACQLDKNPNQDWNASHLSLENHNQGFVKACTPVAMGYWTGDDLPFYYGLGKTFALCDRWFGSCLAQTYPNRRYLMAGTSYGTLTTNVAELTTLAPPPNGTIFDRLDAHDISWKDYASDLAQIAIIPQAFTKGEQHVSTIAQYYKDCAAGTLPQFSLVDPKFVTPETSEENPQDIRLGEDFAARVINAAMTGKAWKNTVLIWTYDEHGGYYDHVAPPSAVKPDSIAPNIPMPPGASGGFDRYGFRVPAVIVSPYAKKKYVSHVTHDHTSILKLVETKWNLGALTYRDANADNLLDALDFKKKPAFLHPPKLPKSALERDGAAAKACTAGNPGGAIPQADAVTRAKT
jgi:phospholipase C